MEVFDDLSGTGDGSARSILRNPKDPLRTMFDSLLERTPTVLGNNKSGLRFDGEDG